MARIAPRERDGIAKYLFKSVTISNLKELGKKRGIICKGSKSDVIQTLLTRLDSKTILNHIQPEKNLPWYANLFAKSLIDGNTTKRSILKHPAISALLENIKNDTRISYEIVSFPNDFIRWNRNALVNKGIAILKQTKGKWEYSLLPEFASYLKPILRDITGTWAIEEFVKSEYYNLITSHPFRPLGSLPRQTETVVLDKNPKFPINIFIFSDYRRQKFGPLLDYIEKSKKPDLILYAGDDIGRFNLAPLDKIKISQEDAYDEISEELTPTYIQTTGGGTSSNNSMEWGYLLKLPSDFSPFLIQERIRTISKFVSEFQKCVDTLPDHDVTTINKALAKISNSLFAHEAKFSFGNGKDILVNDSEMKSIILRLYSDTNPFDTKTRYLHSQSIYWLLGFRIDRLSTNRISVRPVKTTENYRYYHVSFGYETDENLFERLSSHSKYGLGAVIGNDDWKGIRAWIYGLKTFDLQLKRLRIGNLLIAGMEGGIVGEDSMYLGPTLYGEEDVRRYLSELRTELGPKDKLILVSHTPPRGILDRAMRFTEGPIGSKALRDFIETESRVRVVLCGHVHRCGGQFEPLGSAEVINASSHDDVFSRANIGWLTLNQDFSTIVQFFKLPSLVQSILCQPDSNNEQMLISEAHLSKGESRAFTAAYTRLGTLLFENLEDLAHMKFELGLPWTLVMMLRELGVTSLDNLAEEHFESIRPRAGMQISHLQQALVKFKRLRLEGNSAFLIAPLDLPPTNKLICFDTEYDDKSQIVLFCFLDMGPNQSQQFWFDEINEIEKFVSRRGDHTFLHWGGSDKMLLNRVLGHDASTFNLLYKVQTALVAQINSAQLKDVYDGLCGHNESSVWKDSFYDIDGIDKLSLCKKILEGANSSQEKKRLAMANKLDTTALSAIVRRLQDLKLGA